MYPLRGPCLARHPRGGSSYQLAGLPSPLQVTLSFRCCRPPPSLAHVPWPIPTSPRAGLQPGSSECLGKWLEQKAWPAARPCWGLGGVGLRPSSPGTPAGVEQSPDRAVSSRSRKPSTCLRAGTGKGRPPLPSRSTCPGFRITSGECGGEGVALGKGVAESLKASVSHAGNSVFEGGLFPWWALHTAG